MITAGIDMGAKTIKVVILNDSQVAAKSILLGGLDTCQSAEQAFDEALKSADLSSNAIEHITATGAGRRGAPLAHDEVTEVGANAKGAVFLFPAARTVIDVGAEEGRGIRCDGGGKVVDSVINEKCAAGAGTFTEAMARALELKLEEMGKLSLQATKAVPMNAQCTVFAESEVVSLVHAKTPKADIVRAVHDAIASRIISMVRRVGVEKEVVLIGGMAKNIGFVDSLKRGLEMDLVVPEEPEFVGALGAALIAAERA
jgi:benzoyl-CoA reductase subunit D